MRSAAARAKFVESTISKGVAIQIRGLRLREGMTQGDLADKIGSDQNAISRMENVSYGRQTLTTLKKIAAEFDVALVVRFVPFSQLVDWTRGTPRVDEGLREDALIVPNFEAEMESGAFETPTETVTAPAMAGVTGNALAARAAGTPMMTDYGTIDWSQGLGGFRAVVANPVRLERAACDRERRNIGEVVSIAEPFARKRQRLEDNSQQSAPPKPPQGAYIIWPQQRPTTEVDRPQRTFGSQMAGGY